MMTDKSETGASTPRHPFDVAFIPATVSASTRTGFAGLSETEQSPQDWISTRRREARVGSSSCR
ncbi:hypothetical protein NZA98_19335, partial [Escherichia coli]|nr:hypothetical protein [Escherichia coli]